MPLWTAPELMDALSVAVPGDWPGDWQVTGVQIDSRAVRPGDLFIALPGRNTDGNAFVDDALNRGAVGALVTVPHPDPRCIVVADGEAALWQLGAAARRRLGGQVVGVTGSVGKTTTKDMLRLILAATATEGNLNNHLGVPLTLARLPRATQTVVLELGMNHAGEILRLAALARPDVAVITAIAAVHLEHFQDIRGIAAAKAEIYAGLGADGVAVVPVDAPAADVLRAAVRGPCVTFGERESADCRLLGATPCPEGLDVTFNLHGTVVAGRIASWNMAAAHCALAAIATATACGVNSAAAMAALARWQPPAGRGAVVSLPWRGGTLVLMDDSYNASPIAVTAALHTLARLPGTGRRVAVLGDMLELGSDGVALHTGLAEVIRNLPIDRVDTAGPLMQHLFRALPPAQRGVSAATAADLIPQLLPALEAGDMVLVKGSAGMQMKTVVGAIRNS